MHLPASHLPGLPLPVLLIVGALLALNATPAVDAPIAKMAEAPPPLDPRQTHAFAAGLRLLQAAHGPDGTAVTLGWEAPPGPQADALLVQQAPESSGPWRTVAQLQGHVRHWTDPHLTRPTWYRVVLAHAGAPLLETDAIQALPVEALQYDELEDGLPLRSLVRLPPLDGPSPRPLVLLVHGSHGNCRMPQGDLCPDRGRCPPGSQHVPSAAGLAGLADTLAARGFVAASLDVSDLGCLLPEQAAWARVDRLEGHLRLWHRWAALGRGTLGERLFDRVDLERLGLVGHSTGGEAVALLPARLKQRGEPWSLAVRVRSIVAVAPTDFLAARPEGVDYAVVLPSCDIDNGLLTGRAVFDRLLAAGPGPESHGPSRAQWLLIGADHNGFNAEWPPDAQAAGFSVCPAASQIGATAQQAFLAAAAGDWLASGLTRRGEGPPPWLSAAGPVPAGLTAWVGRSLDLRVSFAAPRLRWIDRGTDPPLAPRSPTGFDEVLACQGPACSPELGDAETAVRLTWSHGRPLLAWDLGGLDAHGATDLSLRLVARLGTPTARKDLRFHVRLFDTAGRRIEVASTDLQPVRPPFAEVRDAGWVRHRREVLTTVRVPLVTSDGRWNRRSLARLELHWDDEAGGQVLLTDVALAWPAGASP